MDVICLNGEFIMLEEARVSASDGGLLLGDGVFETIRVEQGQILNYREHFARLARGVRVLEIPFAVSTEELLALCQQTIDANGHAEARLRLTVTRGPLRNLPITPSEGEPTVIIMATARNDQHDELREIGWRLAVSPYPRNHRSPVATIKSTSYTESLISRRYAVRLGFDEALMLNSDGLVAEAAMANLFAVRSGQLTTPPVHDGALPGIMRGRLLDLAQKMGIEVHEASLTVEDLVSADEVFCTNSLIQIMPVVQLGERTIHSGVPGTLTMALFREWRNVVKTMMERTRR